MTRVFSAAEFASAAGISRHTAASFLEDFAAAGVVVRVDGGWTATWEGLMLSRGLALIAPERAEAA